MKETENLMDNIWDDVPLHVLVCFPSLLLAALLWKILFLFLILLILLHPLLRPLAGILLHLYNMDVLDYVGIFLGLKTWEEHFLWIFHWRFNRIWKNSQAHTIKVIEERVGLKWWHGDLTMVLIQEVKELYYWGNYHFG